MAELSLYKLNNDKASKSGDTFSGQITSTVSDKAPFILDAGAANYIVTNLNADKLDGYEAAAFLKLVGGTMTGDITFTPSVSSASKGIVWSGLTDTHSIFVEEYAGTDSTRLVVQNKDNGDTDYTVFRNFSNATTSIDALEVHNTYLKTPVQIQSTVVGTTSTGSAPFTVLSTKKVANLNADMLDDMSATTASTASTVAARDASGNLTAKILISDVTQGTAPLTVTSTTVVTNLNADKVDGYDATSFKLKISTAVTDFGAAPALADGEYYVSSATSVTGAPKTGAIYGKLYVSVSDGGTYNGSSNSIWQTFEDSTGGIYKRYRINAAAWSDWTSVITGANAGGSGVDASTLGGLSKDQFALKSHALVDTTNHTVSGLTANTVLTALTASTYGFASASSHGNHVPTVETANNAKFLRNDNSWATVTPANIGAAATAHGNHVPTTQTANNTTFLRNDNTWYQVTLTDLGAAAASHGNHVPTTGTADNKKFLRNDNTWADVTPGNIGAAPSGYGLGTTGTRLTSGTDLNTVIANGWYDVQSPVNGVTGITWHSVLVIAANDTGYVTQMAFSMSDGTGNSAYIRQKRTTWTTWAPISTVLGTSTAGFFDNSTTAPTSTWTNRLNWGGVFYASKVYNAVFNDYAEYFEKDDKTLEPGDVVIKNPNGKGYAKSRQSYDKLVVGVYSDDYGQCIGGNGDGHDEENFASVGMAGRVRAKVTGNVEEGDLIVASNIPGVAMVCENYKPGTVIGKALEAHTGDSVDRIQILIMNM